MIEYALTGVSAEELEAFADVLRHTKIGISAEEATKAFHNMAKLLNSTQDAECSSDLIFKPTLAETMNSLSKRYDDLLRPETPECAENPNEKCHFNFLEQNAYNKIEPIFNEDALG